MLPISVNKDVYVCAMLIMRWPPRWPQNAPLAVAYITGLVQVELAKFIWTFRPPTLIFKGGGQISVSTQFGGDFWHQSHLTQCSSKTQELIGTVIRLPWATMGTSLWKTLRPFFPSFYRGGADISKFCLIFSLRIWSKMKQCVWNLKTAVWAHIIGLSDIANLM